MDEHKNKASHLNESLFADGGLVDLGTSINITTPGGYDTSGGINLHGSVPI